MKAFAAVILFCSAAVAVAHPLASAIGDNPIANTPPAIASKAPEIGTRCVALMDSGMLTISANRCTLNELLAAIAEATGASIEGTPAEDGTTMSVHSGPGDPVQVVNAVLHGIEWEYYMQTRANGSIESITLTSRLKPHPDPVPTDKSGEDGDSSGEPQPADEPESAPKTAAPPSDDVMEPLMEFYFGGGRGRVEPEPPQPPAPTQMKDVNGNLVPPPNVTRPEWNALCDMYGFGAGCGQVPPRKPTFVTPNPHPPTLPPVLTTIFGRKL